MADKDHAEQLRTVRQILVEERRKKVDYILDHKTNPSTQWQKSFDHIVDLQKDIETIDRAIADEEALKGSVYQRRGPLTV